MEIRFRRAVRVVCLDASDRVLLLRWRDPVGGSLLWEPPGGGVDPGEDYLATARRELVEETGLDPARVSPVYVEVRRDVVWKGVRYTGPEAFFLARFDTDAPALSRDGLLDYEAEDLQEHRWVPLGELGSLERLEPPELADVVADLSRRTAPDPRVESFLTDRYGDRASAPVLLGAGEWSRAYAFTLDGTDMIVKFGSYGEDYAKDQAMAVTAGATVPVPYVLETGRDAERFFLVARRAHGAYLDGLDADAMRAVLPSLFDTVKAIREVDVSAGSGYGLTAPDGNAPHATWAQALTAFLDAPEDPRTGGWRAAMAASPTGTAAFEEAAAVLRDLAPGLSVRRRLIHSDLLYRNVLVDGGRVSSVLDWGNAMAGDGLYDLAWLVYWWRWYPAWRGIDIAAAVEEHLRGTGEYGPDTPVRLRACLLHIGLTAQVYNAATGRLSDLASNAAQTLEYARS